MRPFLGETRFSNSIQTSPLRRAQILPGPVVGPVSQEEAMSSQFTSINGNITKAEWAPEADAVRPRKLRSMKSFAPPVKKPTACLVYANDQAMNFPSLEISPALRQWITQDNTAFEQELSAEVDRREIEHNQDARQAEGMAEWDRAVRRSESEVVQEGAFEEVKLGMDGTQMNGDPPPYEEVSGAYQHVEMLEKPRQPVFGESRVGRHAEDMLKTCLTRWRVKVMGRLMNQYILSMRTSRCVRNASNAGPGDTQLSIGIFSNRSVRRR
jgi:hypothetical protein